MYVVRIIRIDSRFHRRADFDLILTTLARIYQERRQTTRKLTQADQHLRRTVEEGREEV